MNNVLTPENIETLKVNTDQRGWLSVLFKDEKFGQVYIFVAHPGIMRGNHYHKRKTEYFCFLQGSGELLLEDIKTKEVQVIKLSDKNLQVVKINPNIAHKVVNTGTKELHVIALIDEVFNENDPDTHFYDVGASDAGSSKKI